MQPHWQAESYTDHVMVSILSGFDDLETQTYHPYIEYPSLESFLESLDNVELNQHWSEHFLTPLTRMGVQSLDDITLVTPESIHVFFKLPPIAIMDLFSHVLKAIHAIHRAKPLLIARYHQHFQVSTIMDSNCKGVVDF